MCTLTANCVHLLDRIVSDNAFVTDLAAAGCITPSQRDHLLSIAQLPDRNAALFESLAHGNDADFNKFINVISKDQAHLVPLLTTDGVVVRLDAEMDELSVDDITQCEDRVVNQSRALLPDGSHDEIQQGLDDFNEILRPLGLQTRLVVVERANSLALYLICLTLSALLSLRDQWRSRQLRDIVQSLFTFLSGAARTVRVKRLTWPLTDYERCLDFFHSSDTEAENGCEAVELPSDVSELSVRRPESFTTTLCDLPVEMLEAVLMRTFLMLYSSEIEGDDDNRPYKSGKSLKSESRAFALLASVSSCWRHTLIGWPHSPTGRWVRHQLKKMIECSCRPFQRLSELQYSYDLDVEHVFSMHYFFTTTQTCEVESVTQLRDVVFILCARSSTILRYDAVTHHRMTDIECPGMMSPHDIVACEQTTRLYIADYECVFRVSTDGSDVRRWLDTVRPWTLSVRSARLLVTSVEKKQLVLFTAGGDELRHVQLPLHLMLRHGVESPNGTFIISYCDGELSRNEIAEINDDGEILHHFRRFSPQSVFWPDHLMVSCRGKILVADAYNSCVMLMDSELSLRRVIIDEHQLDYKPLRGLSYVEQTGQLLVALNDSVAVYSMLSH